MSHFTVAVFSKSNTEEAIDRLLAPYYEATENKRYLEFEPDEYGDFDEEMKEKGFWVNPNAKWDWFVIGGRWRGYLRLKPGRSGNLGEPSWTNEDKSIPEDRVDQAFVRDVDFNPDKAAYENAIRFWEIVVEGQPLKDGETEPFSMWKPEYFIEQYRTKEHYAECQASWSTYAFVTSSGEWRESGEMGWFCMSDATYEKREVLRSEFMQYVEEHPDEYITIVDCHI